MLEFENLKALLNQNGFPAFRAKQIYHAIYTESKKNYDEMTNLPNNLKEFLKTNVNILNINPVVHAKSSDGTIKTLFQLHDGKKIESVMMEFDDGRITVCISCQVGCVFRCKFCATGSMGFSRNLSAEEMTDQ